MAGHNGPASLRPRFTRSGNSVAAIPVYLLQSVEHVSNKTLTRLHVPSKAVPAQAQRVPGGSQILRQSTHGGGKAFSPTQEINDIKQAAYCKRSCTVTTKSSIIQAIPQSINP
jgi:hypothetical protein